MALLKLASRLRERAKEAYDGEGPFAFGVEGGPAWALSLGDLKASTEVQVVTAGTVSMSLVIGAISYTVQRSPCFSPLAKKAILASLLLGSAAVPFAVFRWHGPMRSRVANFTLSYPAVLCTFRLIELMRGSGPKGFDASLKNFIIYFTSPAEVLFENGQPKSVLPGQVPALLKRTFWECFFQVVFLSLARATNYVPFLGGPDVLPRELPRYGWPRALPSIYLQACNVYSMLSCAMVYHRLPLAMMGFDTLDGMDHPLFLSTSVRDYWGRRWNLIIHRLMKRTWFDPQAQSGAIGKNVGGMLAFLMSALFHEYMWLVVSHEDKGFYEFGGPLLFFVVQYMLGAVEATMLHTPVGQFMARLPTPLLTLCTAMAILPWGPLFLHGITKMAQDSLWVFPTVVPMDKVAGPRLFLVPRKVAAGGSLSFVAAVLMVLSYLRQRAASGKTVAFPLAAVLQLAGGL